MRRTVGVLAGLILLFSLQGAVAEEATITRIGLGSCLRQDRPQPIWEAVLNYRPELFIMLGDNIYADTDDMEVMKAKYQLLGENPGFQKLRERATLLATWDDHDYGRNDAGEEYEHKAAAQRVFNDFFQVPADSPRRQREGIYDAHVFGPPGKRVQVILLDTRYFRSALAIDPIRTRGKGPYIGQTDPAATMLGDAQWAWLKEQLAVPAEVRIIASSIQFIADEHQWERWGSMPAERRRLLNLLAETQASGAIILSGDRHTGELSCMKPEDSGLDYPLYDLTSSSMNVPGGDSNKGEPNRHRVGESFGGENFGSITIDWSQADPQVTLTLHNINGESVVSATTPLSELQAK